MSGDRAVRGPSSEVLVRRQGCSWASFRSSGVFQTSVVSCFSWDGSELSRSSVERYLETSS